jgi:uncharacterized membrane protein
MSRGRTRWLNDARGGMTVVVAAGIIFLAGTVAIALDTGAAFLAQKRVQGAADLAAIKAATDLANANAVASASLARNIPAGSLAGTPQVEIGAYPPSGYTMQTVGALAVQNRFEANVAIPNAVRVTVRMRAPSFFIRLFRPDPLTVAAQATAFNKPLTHLAARSVLGDVDSGKMLALNTALSSLLGATVNLTAANYQALVEAEIRLLALLDALAPVLGVSAGDYNAVLAHGMTLPNVLDAAVAAVQGDTALSGSSATIVAALNSLKGQTGGAPSFNLASVVELDADDPRDGAAARVNLLDLVRAAAEAANDQNATRAQVAVPVAGGVVNVTMAAIAPTKLSATGSAGITVRTSQMRIYAEAIPDAKVNVLGSLISSRYPIFIQLAGGSAAATDVACTGPDASTATVQSTAQSGAATATVGNIDPTALHQAIPPATSPAFILNVANLVRIDGSAQVAVSGPQESPSFAPPFDSSNSQTIELNQPFTSLMSTTLGDLDTSISLGPLNLGILGIPLVNAAAILTAVLTNLNQMAPAVDELLDDTLAGLGTAQGYLRVAATYMRCSNPTLAG